MIDRLEPQEDSVRTAIAQIYTCILRAGRDRRSLQKSRRSTSHDVDFRHVLLFGDLCTAVIGFPHRHPDSLCDDEVES